MRKYLYPAIFILLLALNVAGYAFIAFELDGSSVTTKQSKPLDVDDGTEKPR